MANVNTICSILSQKLPFEICFDIACIANAPDWAESCSQCGRDVLHAQRQPVVKAGVPFAYHCEVDRLAIRTLKQSTWLTRHWEEPINLHDVHCLPTFSSPFFEVSCTPKWIQIEDKCFSNMAQVLLQCRPFTRIEKEAYCMTCVKETCKKRKVLRLWNNMIADV